METSARSLDVVQEGSNAHPSRDSLQHELLGTATGHVNPRPRHEGGGTDTSVSGRHRGFFLWRAVQIILPLSECIVSFRFPRLA